MSWATRKRSAVAIVVLAAGATSLALLPSAHAVAKVTTNRYAGPDRYGTALALAEHAFPTGSQAAVLARGQDFPDGTKGFADALAGNYLAGAYNAPVLLTDADTVPAATLQAFKDMKVKDVAILGGTNAISQAVQAELEATPSTNAAGGNLVTERIAGADRYDTAALVAESVPSTTIGTINGLKTALIATGVDFPDALAGGPVAFANHFPLLLTTPASLSPATASALQTLGIKAALILGGTAAVSSATEQSIQSMGITTQRLAGTNRQQTAAEVADYAIAYLKFKNTLADLARGDNYPDSLAGGAEAGKLGPYPIVLTVSPTVLGVDTASWLQSVDGTLAEVDALGGTAAVSDAVLQQASGDATCVVPTSSTTTSPGGILTTLVGGGSSTTSQASTTLPGGGSTTTPSVPSQCQAPMTTTSTSSTTSTTVSSTSSTSSTSTTLPGLPAPIPLG